MRSIANFVALKSTTGSSQSKGTGGHRSIETSDNELQTRSLETLGKFLAHELVCGNLVLRPYTDEATVVQTTTQEAREHVEYVVKYEILHRTCVLTSEAESNGEDAEALGQEMDEQDLDYLKEFRRYSKFKELHEKLRQRFPQVRLPNLPQGRWIKLFRRSFDPEHIERKSQDLSNYLEALALIDKVNSSPEFLSFVLGRRFEDFVADVSNCAGLSSDKSSVSNSSTVQHAGRRDFSYPHARPQVSLKVDPLGENVTRKVFRAPNEDEVRALGLDSVNMVDCSCS